MFERRAIEHELKRLHTEHAEAVAATKSAAARVEAVVRERSALVEEAESLRSSLAVAREDVRTAKSAAVTAEGAASGAIAKATEADGQASVMRERMVRLEHELAQQRDKRCVWTGELQVPQAIPSQVLFTVVLTCCRHETKQAQAAAAKYVAGLRAMMDAAMQHLDGQHAVSATTAADDASGTVSSLPPLGWVVACSRL